MRKAQQNTTIPAKFMLYRRENRGGMIGLQTKIASRLQKGGIRMTKYRILMADSNLQFQTAVRD